MRTLYFLFLLAFIAALGIFAWQNQESVTVTFLQWQISIMLAAVAGVSYLLGMLSGWSVVGMVRRSIHRVTDRPT
jgi:lipopolysaccharide assembly protein A